MNYILFFLAAMKPITVIEQMAETVAKRGNDPALYLKRKNAAVSSNCS